MVVTSGASVLHVVVIEPANVDADRSARVQCTNAGLVTFTATTGGAGLVLTQRIHPDAVVLDDEVSDPGWDVVLRRLQLSQSCPIVTIGPSVGRFVRSHGNNYPERATTAVTAVAAVNDVVRTVTDAVARWRAEAAGDTMQYADLMLDLRYEQAYSGGRRIRTGEEGVDAIENPESIGWASAWLTLRTRCARSWERNAVR